MKESLRQFLRLNRGIRTLDLSHNKFTAETLNAIHLGLLENDGKQINNLLFIIIIICLFVYLTNFSILLFI